ncbi:hypothetical protein [Bosea sp. Leaf344]|uniref:hypothetical protein n=1 Tax=Bosea sp. Leaf344 TaxID=1736346 RepID=UPI0012E3D620|nr:hypothetical protein [Bosea sp. Leaf344]
MAAEVVRQYGGDLTAVLSDKSEDVILENIPSQGVGPHFEVSQDFVIDRVDPPYSLSANEYSRITEKLQPLVVKSAKDLSVRLIGNQFRELHDAVSKYIDLLDKNDLRLIAWSEVWGMGVIIRNILDASERHIRDRMLPELEDPAKAAIESLLTLHGPMILSTRDGQELSDQSSLFDKGRAERAVLKEATEEIAAAVSRRTDIATKSAAETVASAADAMAEGSHPERGAVYGLASVRNVMIPLVAAAVVTSPSTLGYLTMGQPGAVIATPFPLVAVEGLKKSPQFMSFISALGSKFDDAFEKDPLLWLRESARRLAPFRSFFIENKDSLLKITSKTPELRWLEKYIRLIEEDTSIN